MFQEEEIKNIQNIKIEDISPILSKGHLKTFIIFHPRFKYKNAY